MSLVIGQYIWYELWVIMKYHNKIHRLKDYSLTFSGTNSNDEFLDGMYIKALLYKVFIFNYM